MNWARIPWNSTVLHDGLRGLFNIVQKINFKLPKKFEGTIVERSVTFWKNLYVDYKEAALEVTTFVQNKPKKAIFYISGFGFLSYCVKYNPDELSYRDDLIACGEKLILVSAPLRNPATENKLQFIETCYSEGRIRRFSIGLLSFIWVSDYTKESGTFESQCSYCSPRIESYSERCLDIGFLGKWWGLSNIMKEYDVNTQS